MKPKMSTPIWSSIIFMLGAYAFGFNLHNIIHEFGHAVAVWVQGGKMTGFYFHPFDSCLNFSTYVPNHILLYAGGAFIGGASTIIFPVIAWKHRSPFLMPFVMACAAGLTTTARWMLIAPFSDMFTDYTSMISLGVPAALIVTTGVLYLLLGVGVLILFLPLLGISYETGILRRLVIFELGILPYNIFTVLYAWLVKKSQPQILLAGLVIAAIFLAIEAVLSKWLPRRFAFFRKIEPVRLRKCHIIAVWIGVAILIALMFLVSTNPGELSA